MRKCVVLMLGLAGLLALAACTQSVSVEQAVAEGTIVPLNTEETIAVYSGNSEVWPGKGAAYYQEDGTVLGIWKGDKIQGTWWVENDMRCYDVVEWDGEWCHKMYRREDGVFVGHRVGSDTLSKEGTWRIEPGNQVPE